jgi:ornithine decarboxylase
VLDLDRVQENYQRLHAAFPNSRLYYSVKANPARPILERLLWCGSRFEVASFEEAEACLSAGASPDDIAYGNPIKKERDIHRAFAAGIRLYAFDCEAELLKLARSAPGSRVYCRIVVGNSGAVFPLTRKFGCDPELAMELTLKVRDLGLDAYGLSFHVGSQQINTVAYDEAITSMCGLFEKLLQRGLELKMLNFGGGFPVRYRHDIPTLEDYGRTMFASVTRCMGNKLPEIFIEPGRCTVGDAGVLSSEVVLVARRQKNASVRWVYLDIGRFGGLAETEGEATKYVLQTLYDHDDGGPVIIAGPTCDDLDVLFEKTPYSLPLALAAGDKVEILGTGAYVTTYASQGFNGYKPLAEIYI